MRQIVNGRMKLNIIPLADAGNLTFFPLKQQPMIRSNRLPPTSALPHNGTERLACEMPIMMATRTN